ncbi:MAG: sulfotransferase domain-containing protein [Candidatus Sericytochromatia bacterium]
MQAPLPELAEHVIGLGLIEQAQNDVYLLSQLIAFLEQRPPESAFVLLGHAPWAGDLADWAANTQPQDYLGHFPDISLYNESPQSYTNFFIYLRYCPLPAETNLYYLLCLPPGDYLSTTRNLLPKLNFKGTWVLPFLPAGHWPNRDFDPHQPLLIHTVTRSGTLRFWPVLASLLKALGRQTAVCGYPDENRRIMSGLRWPDETQQVEPLPLNALTDPVARIRLSMMDPHLRFPSREQIQAYYLQELADLDYYQARLLHCHVFVPLEPLLELANIRLIALIRDPRDVLISFYFAYLNKGYFLDHQRYQTEYPQVYKEALLLSLAERGWQYLSFNKLMDFPDLKTLAQHYLSCLNSPQVYVVRFEDLHQAPEATYLKLLSAQGLLEQPYYSLAPEQFKQALRLEDFEFQTQGRRKRGQAMEPQELNYGSHRRGLVGDWQNHLSPQLKEQLKALIGPELIQLGYERDLNW